MYYHRITSTTAQFKRIVDDDINDGNNRPGIITAKEVRNLNGGIASGKFMAGGCNSYKDEPIDFDEITETDEEDD